MYEKIDGLRIYYEVSGQGLCVLLLHGWGGSVNSLRPIFNRLRSQYRVYALDLPGFGRSEAPPCAWGSAEYAKLVAQFFTKAGLSEAHVIAHSFGGRVAICLCAHYPQLVRKLVLVDSAGIKPRRGPIYYLKVGTAKAAKYLLTKPIFGKYGSQLLDTLYRCIGSADYRRAGSSLRATLVKVVNEDLRHLLGQISQPTLLIWGEQDTVTPVSDARLMKSLLPNASLVILANAGHYAYLDQPFEFCKALSQFLESTHPC